MWLSALANLIPAAIVAVVLARLWRPLRNVPGRTSLACALGCAALLRLLWIAFAPGVQAADFAWYGDRANSLFDPETGRCAARVQTRLRFSFVGKLDDTRPAAPRWLHDAGTPGGRGRRLRSAIDLCTTAR